MSSTALFMDSLRRKGQRARELFKELQSYGDVELAKLTVADALQGVKGLPILVSLFPQGALGEEYKPVHRVEPRQGFILGGRPIPEVLAEGRSFEWLFGTMLLAEPPTPEEEESLRLILEEERMRLAGSQFWTDLEQSIRFASPTDEPADPMMAAAQIIARWSGTSRMARLIADDKMAALSLETRFADAVSVLAMLGLILPAWFRVSVLNDHPIAPVEGKTFGRSLVDGFGLAKSDEEIQVHESAMNLLLGAMIYHGAGNLSTFAAKVAASGGATMHADFLTMVGALSGPNHGGAAFMGIRFLLTLRQQLEEGSRTPSFDDFAGVAEERIAAKEPVWCVGHGVLQVSDPRTTAILGWFSEHYPKDPFVRFAQSWYDAAKEVLKVKTNIRTPEVNIDGNTGLVAALLGLAPSISASRVIGGFFMLGRWAGVAAEILWQWESTGKPRIIRPGSLQFELPKRELTEASSDSEVDARAS